MKTLGRVSLALVAVMALSAVKAEAQNTCSANPCSLNDTVKVTVASVLRLTLSQFATTLTPPNEAAYDAGFQNDNGPTATVKANRGWTLKISAAAGTWTAANGANGAKSAGDLQWSTSSGGSYTSLSTTPATFSSAASGNSGVAQPVYYKTLWSYSSDTPGDYSLVVVYTLSAP